MSGTTSSDRKVRFSMAFSEVRLGARSRVAQLHLGDPIAVAPRVADVEMIYLLMELELAV
jgi:hypothetical protein